MTVCVAALANHGKAIVLVADKALTYGTLGQGAMQGESRSIEKRLEIGDSGWHVLLAGDATLAESVVAKAAARTIDNHDMAKSYDQMMVCLRECYHQVREQLIEDLILRPRLLTRELFVARSSGLLALPERMVTEVLSELGGFRTGTSLLVCGFDERNDGCIFSVNDPGVIETHNVAGFGAIGIGAGSAIARFLWQEAEEEDDLDVALYQAIDAKAHAEIIQGVGYRSDAWIMVPGKITQVPVEILALLEDVFRRTSLSPFKPRAEWLRKPRVPKNWEKILRDFTDSVSVSAPG